MTQTKTMDRMDINEICALLPHRYPFLLIDRVIDIKGDDSATGIKNVTFNEPHFNGHFPGAPIMPGVLIVEAMAQVCGAIVARQNADGVRKLVYFMTIDGAKFRRPVVPGDVLHLKVQKLKQRGKIFRFDCQAFVGDSKAAEATISAMMVEAGDQA